MDLGAYLQQSGRSVNDLHCASRVRYATVLDVSKGKHLLSRVHVARRLVAECEGKVGLKDVLRPDVYEALVSTGTDDHDAEPPQSGTPAQGGEFDRSPRTDSHEFSPDAAE